MLYFAQKELGITTQTRYDIIISLNFNPNFVNIKIKICKGLLVINVAKSFFLL
jgi:hypothetical protein